MWSPDMLILVSLIFVVGGFVKGVVGIGLPTVAIALSAALIGLKEGIALMVVPTIITNIWQAVVGGHLIALLRRLWMMLVAAIIGAYAGGGLLARADAHTLAAALGVLLCLYSAYSLARPQLPSPGRAETWLSPLIGAVSGVIAGLTGTYAVPGVLYLQALRLPRDELVQAMGITFMAFTSALGLSLLAHGLMPFHIGMLSAVAVVPALAGMAIGQGVRRRLSETLFRRLFFIALFGLGLYLAVRPLLL